MKLLVAFTCLLIIFTSLAESNLDKDLSILIKENDLKPLSLPKRKSRKLIRLGALLFSEKEMSGDRNISCMDCHHPSLGTADGLAFSIGAGGAGIGTRRVQNHAGVTKRHSPHLLNLGFDDIPSMFWDGRVAYDKAANTLSTPEKSINGAKPRRKDISRLLTSALAAQSIFPLADHLEMRGHSGNELAEANSNQELWRRVVKRLMKKNVTPEATYTSLFQSAYPEVEKEKHFNIGHVGNALAAFIGGQFLAINTPYDDYLNGNVSAMSKSEKKGLKVFLTRGQCIRCHLGRHLSDFDFKSVGTPQIGLVGSDSLTDKGRFEVTGKKIDQFKYRTPALRNLAVTAPYMHNGAFTNIEQVVEHYNNVKVSNKNYIIPAVYQELYNTKLVIDDDVIRNKLRINLISIDEVRRGVNLTSQEKNDLIAFLKTGLLDYRFQRNRL